MASTKDKVSPSISLPIAKAGRPRPEICALSDCEIEPRGPRPRMYWQGVLVREPRVCFRSRGFAFCAHAKIGFAINQQRLNSLDPLLMPSACHGPWAFAAVHPTRR